MQSFTLAGGTVVYAGCSPGQHIQLLAALFPQLPFILYDPRPLLVDVLPSNCLFFKEMFTHEVALSVRERINGNLFFISDVRSTVSQLEADVARDMTMQMQWHLILKPKAALYKFRLPWAEGFTEYLSGEVQLPIWGSQTTSESRLLVGEGIEMTSWSNVEYNEQMSYHQSVTRALRFPHSFYDRKAGVYVQSFIKAFFDDSLSGRSRQASTIVTTALENA